MKHGPIALLDSRVPVIGIVTEGRVREKMLSNLAEAKAREAITVVVANHGEDVDQPRNLAKTVTVE